MVHQIHVHLSSHSTSKSVSCVDLGNVQTFERTKIHNRYTMECVIMRNFQFRYKKEYLISSDSNK